MVRHDDEPTARAPLEVSASASTVEMTYMTTAYAPRSISYESKVDPEIAVPPPHALINDEPLCKRDIVRQKVGESCSFLPHPKED